MVAHNVTGPRTGEGERCFAVLQELPGWFGIPEANEQYRRDIEVLPTFVVEDGERVAGFLTVKQHNEHAAEVLVMGVRPDYHRDGIGSALMTRAEGWLRKRGVEWLQVKTLGPSEPDEGYERTRAFYLAEGFWPLEELKTLWDKNNPALLLIKRLDP